MTVFDNSRQHIEFFHFLLKRVPAVEELRLCLLHLVIVVEDRLGFFQTALAADDEAGDVVILWKYEFRNNQFPQD